MAIKSFNPYSPSRRFITVSAFEEITTDKPYRPLVEKLSKHAGRNNTGKMTVRHQGGGAVKGRRLARCYRRGHPRAGAEYVPELHCGRPQISEKDRQGQRRGGNHRQRPGHPPDPRRGL